LSRTYRRKDIKYPKGKVHDGKCWRGCDGGHCPWCIGNRTNKKIKEIKRAKDILNG